MKTVILLVSAFLAACSNAESALVDVEKTLSFDESLAVEYHRAQCRWMERLAGSDANGEQIPASDPIVKLEKGIEGQIYAVVLSKDSGRISAMKERLKIDAALLKIISQARAAIEKANRALVEGHPMKANDYKGMMKDVYEIIDKNTKKRQELWSKPVTKM